MKYLALLMIGLLLIGTVAALPVQAQNKKPIVPPGKLVSEAAQAHAAPVAAPRDIKAQRVTVQPVQAAVNVAVPSAAIANKLRR